MANGRERNLEQKWRKIAREQEYQLQMLSSFL
jgi:hypothetical protein